MRAICMHCAASVDVPFPDGWIIRRSWYANAVRFRLFAVAAFCGWFCEREHKAMNYMLDYSGGDNMAGEL